MEVLGAGGAVWGMLWALPNTVAEYACCEQGCKKYGNTEQNVHMLTVVALATLMMINAFCHKYCVNNEKEFEDEKQVDESASLLKN